MSTPHEPDLMTDRAHSARVYDHLLGGKDNYAADRAAAADLLAVWPTVALAARNNRDFMRRAALYLVRSGVRQFLDIGTGIPTEPNLHQVVQAVDPAARVVYTDNDPIVLAHAAALLVGDRRGVVAYLDADARTPESIVESAAVRDTLDLSRPVGISMIALLHFLDDDEAAALLRALRAVVAPGSAFVVSHTTYDTDTSGALRAAQDRLAAAGIRGYPRSAEQLRDVVLAGLDIVEPGIVSAQRWRPDHDDHFPAHDSDITIYGVVARTP